MISYVNSTIEDRRRSRADRSLSPIHFWGYEPRPGDRVRGHPLGRLAIRLRGWTGGLDPWVLACVHRDLRAGARGVYLVTQPDLLRALPWLRRRFPKAKLVTWVWIEQEARAWERYLRVCDHVFCLTPSGLAGMEALGLADRASLQIWGCDPAHYRLAAEEAPREDSDVLLMGLSGRDTSVVAPLLERNAFRVVTTAWTARVMGFGESDRLVRTENPQTERQLVTLLHRSRLVWIPLRVGDVFPTGYTNLIEAVLSGTAVVIADVSPIPQEVLSLPGVYRYETGSADSLEQMTREAVAAARKPGFRAAVQSAAARLLNAERLKAAIHAHLELAPAKPSAD